MELKTASPTEKGVSATRLVKAKEYAQRVGDQLSNPPTFLYDRDDPMFMDLVTAAVDKL